ncbi:OmpH family outer membrane protein [Chitinophagaceae bacterium LB-8]|jgi:outer membrane protein|uniref:OmpH family outer membrane protein n=1 Tax=Paraflavisolibacter caeni TaxID=2982496 RepID=A0A9X3B8E2_9BACT|nr:OmpH family outer membrane protein [Paraflavisolibacter caeni]MCU7549651.1 OmpH family outer membrane protein [Paraflavisolibacter caeni]
MNRGLLVSNIILFILVGVLFFLHLSSGKNPGPKAAVNKEADPVKEFKIAYFEMDSLENSFSMVKDVKAELGKKEDAINSELARLEKTVRDKGNMYQSQAATMNQVQSEMATRDMMQLQQSFQSRKQALDQEYQDFYMRKMRDVKTKIEDYLKDYNQTKGYSYIFAYEPGLFYYRDTVYNITNDLIKGLNNTYTKK